MPSPVTVETFDGEHASRRTVVRLTDDFADDGHSLLWTHIDHGDVESTVSAWPRRADLELATTALATAVLPTAPAAERGHWTILVVSLTAARLKTEVVTDPDPLAQPPATDDEPWKTEVVTDPDPLAETSTTWRAVVAVRLDAETDLEPEAWHARVHEETAAWVAHLVGIDGLGEGDADDELGALDRRLLSLTPVR